MTTRQPGFLHYLFPASSLLALLSFTGGIYGLVSPAEWAPATIGLTPTPAASNNEKAYAAFAAARNVGGGVTLAVLIAQGNRKAVGTYLMTGMTTALLDGWICAQYGGAKALGHTLMGLLVGAVGYGVWLTG